MKAMKGLKKEIELLEKKQPNQNNRGETFVGFRPVVFGSKKYNKKSTRREGKKLCANY